MKHQTPRNRLYLLLFSFCLFHIAFLLPPHSSQASGESGNISEEIKIGLLALRGKEKGLQQWQATAEYLTNKIPAYRFSIVPLDFDEMGKAVKQQEVHFTITNSSMYVSLESHYGNTRIATMKTNTMGQGLTKFGGVIFTSNNQDAIHSLQDLRGKSFMAVDNKSFGGWHMAWRHLLENEIDPTHDFKSFSIGGTHDAVVMAVLNKTVDAGTVRTSILEQMAQEGKISLDQIRVLDNKSETTSNFKHLHSTILYPEWPFAKVRHTDEELARKVAIALLQMEPIDNAAKAAQMMGWTIPLDYQSVHDCLKKIKFDPYDASEPITIQQLIHQYWQWLAAIGLFLALASGGALYFQLLNRKLRLTMTVLDHELAERKRIEKNLNEFKTTLDQIMDCVFMFLPESLHYIYVNRGGIQQVGYSMEELFHMTPVDLKPEFTESSFRTLLEPLLQGKQATLTFTTTHLTKAGEFIPVEVFLQYVQPTGEHGRFVSIVHDISQRLQEEKEKEKLQSQLLHTQKLESVGQLAAGIAHEINTPTQYIGTNIDFLDDGFKDVATLITSFQHVLTAAKEQRDLQSPLEEAAAALETADWEYLATELPLAIAQSKDGVRRISTIVRAMKEFSHPGSKEKLPLNINELIDITLVVSRNEWKYVADLETEFAADLPLVPCLSDEMGQVFLNLLVNAAHAITTQLGDNPESKKGTISITTSAVADNTQVEIRVTDTGCGIPQEIINKVFDPFFTTKEVGKGTGQGLAIARDVIVNKHNGTLEVESVHGQGASFIIKLPVSPE